MVTSPRGFTNPVSTRQEVQQESSASWTTGPSLFGTDGIRGRAGQLLSPALALQVGLSAGRVLLKQARAGAIILGQDSRNSSDSLAMALSAGLTATGVEVWHLGLCPTPGVAYLTTAAQAIGGVMISASHNPPEDNGIKFFGPDGTKSLDLQQQIEAELRRTGVGSLGVAFGAAGGTSSCELGGRWGHHYYRPELVHTYLDSLEKPLLSEVNLQGMRIVLDLAWGAAVYSAPEVFRRLGASLVCLHNRPDGDRINVDCGSTHLAPLQATVQLHGADLGFAFDGDADRVLAVDSQGRTVDGDYILYLWGQTLRRAQQLPDNLIVSTVMANLGFECAWKQSGGELVRTAVGDQYVHAEMQRRNAMLGGEQSGHILCPHYGVSGDGLLTALHLAALVRRAGCTLAELVDQSFQTYPQLLRNVRVEDRDRRLNWQNCDALQAAISQATASMGNQGRILVRASGTEPVIRVMVEACTAELANHWTNNLVLAVQQHLAD